MSKHSKAPFKLYKMNLITSKAPQIVLKAIDGIIRDKKEKIYYKNQQHLKSIIYTILSVTGIDVKTRTNERVVADAVKIYSYMAREYTDNSVKNIGLAINRDHSTISISYKNYNNLYKYDDDFRLKSDQCLTKYFAENGEEQPKDLELEEINKLLLKCNVHLLIKIKAYLIRQIENNG